MQTCLICDDHSLMRVALEGIVRQQWPSVQVTTKADYPSSVEQVRCDFDLCITDLAMPGLTPVEGIKRLLAASPATPILVVTGSYDRRILLNLIQLGVRGFVSKTASIEELGQAIDCVYRGDQYIPDEFADELSELQGAPSQKQISLRQIDVLRMVGEGKSNKEIAKALDVAPSTIKSHLEHAMLVLNASSRAEAVLKAQVSGLL